MINKRDNINCLDTRGVPMYTCDKCKKRFQTKGIAINHNCKVKE